MIYPNLVEKRMKAPPGWRSMCEICPLNGQRKVGSDGPVEADFVVINDFPEREDVDINSTKGRRYGRPWSGKVGYFTKLRHLAPAGLATLTPGHNPRYPRVTALGVHVMNVAMCRPPHGDADTPVGRRAALCCGNSAKYVLKEMLRDNPHRTILPTGNIALALVRGRKAALAAYRGRPLGPVLELPLEPIPEEEIIKYVLKGRKPAEAWWPAFEKWLRSFMKLYRKAERSLVAKEAKAAKAATLAANPWLAAWAKEWQKQKRKMTNLHKGGINEHV